MKNFIEELPKPILIEDLGMMFMTKKSKYKTRFGLFICGFCGTKFKARVYDIKNKHTKSCGCYNKRRIKESNNIHGLGSTRLYTIWGDIKRRTLNPKHKYYVDYGGRGITICEEWKNDVKSFYAWAMSNGYSDELSIDRIDNNGNYEPNNCRWATRTIQSRNQRIYKSNTSGYKGVCYHKGNNKYIAQICVNKKRINIGSYPTAEDGAVEYNNYIIANDLEGFPLNKLPDSHIHLQLPTKPYHQTLE